MSVSKFDYFDLDEPVATFEGFEGIIEAWRGAVKSAGARGAGPLPRWSDISVSDMVGWHAHVARSIDTGDANDVRFLLFGSHMEQLMGSDYTGKCFAELTRPDIFQNVITPHWERFFRKAAIAVGYLPVRIDGTARELRLLHLPLGENDHVTGALHAAQRATPETL